MKKIIFSLCCAFTLLAASAFIVSSPRKVEKQFKKNFSLIPIDQTEGRETSSFYMMNTEVSNGEYTLFLNEVKQLGMTELEQAYSPDPHGWEKYYPFMASFDQHYFSHPAYKTYPVVNISYEAAQAYCNWLTASQKHVFEKEGYYIEYSLPNKTDWQLAAASGHKGMNYAWGGTSLTNNQGCFLSNFRQTEDELIPVKGQESQLTDVSHLSIDSRYEDNAFATAPVMSYSPSSFGLYNMNGNVAEMTGTKGEALGGSWNSTAEEITNQSVMTYTGTSPMVGFRVAARKVMF